MTTPCLPIHPGELSQAIIHDGYQISRDEALALLNLPQADGGLLQLFHYANQIRLQRLGPEISLCSIVSVQTGHCSEDCRFCAQSAFYKTQTPLVTADRDSILAAAGDAATNQAGCIGLVASGHHIKDQQLERLVPVIQEVNESGRISCCAALGSLTLDQAKILVAAGIKRYNHNLETSRRFFPQVVTTHSYEDRITTVKNARQAGMQICCGGIIGLGETLEDRVDLAMELRELEVDTVPLNFLNPIPGTPFEENKPVGPIEALQTIAMFRFVLPDRQIKIAGGRETCLRDLQSWMFFAGASSTMVGNYLTTMGRPADQDRQMLRDLGIPLQGDGA